MARYERVTYRPEGGRARTIYMENVQVMGGGELLTGIEVNREGDEICGAKFDERRHIIELALVERRMPMRMDNIYGELVEA